MGPRTHSYVNDGVGDCGPTNWALSKHIYTCMYVTSHLKCRVDGCSHSGPTNWALFAGWHRGGVYAGKTSGKASSIVIVHSKSSSELTFENVY